MPKAYTENWHQLAALSLVALSFFMTALISRTVFERLPHLEDELAYVYQARLFANGDMTIDIPEPRRAFWQPFVIDYREEGNRFGKYSPGWPLILALGVIFNQLWLINAFTAALTVALTYRLGREIYHPDVGVIAAALVTFSPMALLLNATLMSHTTSLTLFTLFMYAYWRIEKKKRALLWGTVAGIALGLLVISRPLTAIGVTTPFILWSVLRLARSFMDDRQLEREENVTGVSLQHILGTLKPLVALGVVTIVISLFIPFFNYSATGSPTTNLYLEWWDYDQPGFGECCGRNGHTIVKGVRHTRFDLSLAAADLFGWQIQRADNAFGWEAGEITPELQEHLRTSANYWPLIGLSFFILPVGLAVGFRRWWLRIWLLGALYWLIFPLQTNADFLTDSDGLWRWLALGTGWLLIPFMGITFGEEEESSTRWTWLFMAVFVSLIGIHLAYWVGSQRYSTRYYFEALTAFALVAAVGFSWIIRGLGSFGYLISGENQRGYSAGIGISTVLFTGLLLWSLFGYSAPRINALHEFNNVRQSILDSIEDRRQTDDPLAVILFGDLGTVTWRSYGSLMAVTDPYLENDIVAAWNYSPSDPELREDILAYFPDHEIIRMAVFDESAWFIDDVCDDAIIDENGNEIKPGEDVSISPDCGGNPIFNQS